MKSLIIPLTLIGSIFAQKALATTITTDKAFTILPNSIQPARGTVIFCPGTNQPPEHYQAALTKLSNSGYWVIGVRISNFSLTQWTQDTTQLLDALSNNSALQTDLDLSATQIKQLQPYLQHRFLGGQSGGAAVAMRIALTHPEFNLEKIFLWNPADPKSFFPSSGMWGQAASAKKPPLLMTSGNFCQFAPDNEALSLFDHFTRHMTSPPTLESCKENRCSDCMPFAGVGAADHYLEEYKNIGGNATLVAGPWLHTSVQAQTGTLEQAVITDRFLQGLDPYFKVTKLTIAPAVHGWSQQPVTGAVTETASAQSQ